MSHIANGPQVPPDSAPPFTDPPVPCAGSNAWIAVVVLAVIVISIPICMIFWKIVKTLKRGKEQKSRPAQEDGLTTTKTEDRFVCKRCGNTEGCGETFPNSDTGQKFNNPWEGIGSDSSSSDKPDTPDAHSSSQ